MENLILTQLSPSEFRELLRSELQLFFVEKNENSKNETEMFLTIEQAATFLSLSKNTIYTLVHKSKIPVSKQGKRLYFSEQELVEWVKSGRKKTTIEIQSETNSFLSTSKRK